MCFWVRLTSLSTLTNLGPWTTPASSISKGALGFNVDFAYGTVRGFVNWPTSSPRKPQHHEEAARLQKPGVNWDGDFAPASLRAGPSPWGSASSISGSPRPISHQPWSQARPSGSSGADTRVETSVLKQAD